MERCGQHNTPASAAVAFRRKTRTVYEHAAGGRRSRRSLHRTLDVAAVAPVAMRRPRDLAWSITGRITTKPMKSVAKISDRIAPWQAPSRGDRPGGEVRESRRNRTAKASISRYGIVAKRPTAAENPLPLALLERVSVRKSARVRAESRGEKAGGRLETVRSRHELAVGLAAPTATAAHQYRRWRCRIADRVVSFES
jgi:hypothetical protein